MSARTLSSFVLLAALASAGCIIHIDGNGWDGDSAFRSGRYGDRGPRHRGNGVAGTQERQVPAFDAVKLSGSLDVQVHVGEPQSVTVHGDDNLLKFVRTEVNGGSLEVYTDPGRYEGDHDFWVEVHVPDLRALAIYGSGDATVSGIDRDAIAFSINGSGDLRASGRVQSFTVECSGSGEADLSSLEAEVGAVVISGSSDVLVSASKRLDVSISGSGEVHYDGRPSISASISGSGDVGPR